MMGTQKARADEFKMTPSFTIKEQYIDNLFFATSEVKRDFVSTFSPGLAITDRTERMDLMVSGRLDERLYSKDTEFNATDQYYEGTGRYAVTPRLSVSGRALYSLDSRPGRDIETSGLPLTAVQRVRQNYTTSADYMLTDKTTATITYDYLNDHYDNPSFIDMEANTVNLGLAHSLSWFTKPTKARLNLTYMKYSIPTPTLPSMKVETYEATVGIERAINEKWNLVLNGGGRYSQSTFSFIDRERRLGFIPPFF